MFAGLVVPADRLRITDFYFRFSLCGLVFVSPPCWLNIFWPGPFLFLVMRVVYALVLCTEHIGWIFACWMTLVHWYQLVLVRRGLELSTGWAPSWFTDNPNSPYLLLDPPLCTSRPNLQIFVVLGYTGIDEWYDRTALAYTNHHVDARFPGLSSIPLLGWGYWYHTWFFPLVTWGWPCVCAWFICHTGLILVCTCLLVWFFD
jgi:hypothetical protein